MHMPKAAPTEKQHQRLHTVGIIDFTKILQPVIKQMSGQKAPAWEEISSQSCYKIFQNVQLSTHNYKTCRETGKTIHRKEAGNRLPMKGPNC